MTRPPFSGLGEAASDLADLLLSHSNGSRVLCSDFGEEVFDHREITIGSEALGNRLQVELLLPTPRSIALRGAKTGAAMTPGLLYPSSEILARLLLL